MKQLVRNVKIIGTGSYVPETVYTNEYLETILPTTSEWIFENLGIKERRIAAEDEATSDLAWKAGLKAIEHAGLTKDDIDLIIVATATPDRLAPSTACIVQDKLGAYNAVAFDISAVCSGFLFGMSVASQYIASGVYDNVLVIGADSFSKITDWTRRDAVFFWRRCWCRSNISFKREWRIPCLPVIFRWQGQRSFYHSCRWFRASGKSPNCR